MIKNPPASTGDLRDMASIPGSGRSLEEGMATHSSFLAWRIPWTEEPDGLHVAKSCKEPDRTEVTEHAVLKFLFFILVKISWLASS